MKQQRIKDDDKILEAYALLNRIESDEDIIQGCIEKIINLKDKFTAIKFNAFVRTIHRNFKIDSWRTDKTTTTYPMSSFVSSIDGEEYNYVLDGIASNEPMPDEHMINSEKKVNLIELIKELPYRQSEVIMLRYFQKLTYKEIENRTGIKVSSAKGYVSKGVKTLKENFK